MTVDEAAAQIITKILPLDSTDKSIWILSGNCNFTAFSANGLLVTWVWESLGTLIRIIMSTM